MEPGEATAAPGGLTRSDEKLLRRVAARQRLALVTAIILTILGGGYAVWGATQLHPDHAPDPAAAFDRPVARLATLFDADEKRLAALPVETDLEKALVADLRASSDLNARLLLLLIRVLIGSLVLVTGLILLAVAGTQRRFLEIIARLRVPGRGQQPESSTG